MEIEHIIKKVYNKKHYLIFLIKGFIVFSFF